MNWQKRGGRHIHWGSPSLHLTSGLRRRIAAVQPYVSFRGKRVLDIGCGAGIFLKSFKKLGARAYGVDIDREKIRKVPFAVYGNAEQLPFKDDVFDIVWSHEVLEHVDDDKKAAVESFRVLKPGGYLIVFAPNRAWPFETHGIYVGKKYIFGNIPLIPWLPKWMTRRLTPHVRNYTNKQLRSLFLGGKVILHKHVYPGFDKLSRHSKALGQILQFFFHNLERRFHHLGISHVLIVQKPKRNPIARSDLVFLGHN